MILLETARTAAGAELIAALQARGAQVAISTSAAESVDMLKHMAAGPVVYVHAKGMEWAMASAEADLLTELRIWALEFPQLVNGLVARPQSRLLYVGAAAVWGDRADPKLAAYNAWMLGLVRSIPEIAGDALISNFLIAQRAGLPFRADVTADLLLWLAERDVSGQEFDVSAAGPVGVVKW